MGIFPSAVFYRKDNLLLLIEKKVLSFAAWRGPLVALFKRFVLLCSILLSLVGCSLGKDSPEPSQTAPPTQPPTDTAVLMPDLVIRSVSLMSDPSALCPLLDESSPPLDGDYRNDDALTALDSPFSINIRVENQGDRSAGPFIVQLNLDQQLVNPGLQPGEVKEIIFPGYNSLPRVMVDATSLVVESDETNNQIFQRLNLPTPAPECVPTPAPRVAVQQALAELEGHTAQVWDAEFSPDGKVIASGSVDDTLRLWNVDQLRLIRTMQGHPFPILNLKYAPNGATLVTGSTDGFLRLWDVASGRLSQSLEGHTGWITGLDISRDGKWMASSAEDSTVRLWRLPQGSLAQIIDEGMTDVRSVVFSPDSYAIAWGEGDGTIRLRTVSGVWLQSLKAASHSILSVVFSPDGSLLACGDADGVIRIWRVKDGALSQTLRGHTDAVNDLVFSPDGQWLVSASRDKTLRLWQSDGVNFLTLPLMIFQGNAGSVSSVDFSPVDLLVVSGSEDGALRLWSVPAPIISLIH